MNIFEKASASKLRFSSSKGELTTEQLWDLPLQSRSGLSLDQLARDVNRLLKAEAEESFVSAVSNPGKAIQELRLEVLKHIISVKLKAQEDTQTRAARFAERERLVDVLALKQEQELQALSKEDLQKRIAELSD